MAWQTEDLMALNSHNRRALNLLLETHGPRLYATLARLTLRREVAGDLLQELFLRLGQSKGFPLAGDPAGYAFRTAINLAMEWRRGRRRESGVPLPDVPAGEPTPLAR